MKLSPFAYFAYILGLNGYYSMWDCYIDVFKKKFHVLGAGKGKESGGAN